MPKKAQKERRKMIREGGLDPNIHRGTWNRKPQTQVVPNKKAEQRRSYCRHNGEDGAVSA